MEDEPVRALTGVLASHIPMSADPVACMAYHHASLIKSFLIPHTQQIRIPAEARIQLHSLMCV